MSKRLPSDIHLVRLWGPAWQLWRKPTNPAEAPWEFVHETPDLAGVWAETPVVILPSRLVCVGASWVPETDPTMASDSARLLAEAAGWLPPAASEEQVETALLTRTQENTLVRTVVFPVDFSLPAGKSVTAFVPAPLALELPPRSLCCWREGAFYVLVLTGDDGPIIWEARVEEPGSPAWDGWVQSFLLEIQAEGLSTQNIQAMDYSGASPWSLPGGFPVQPEPSLTGPPPRWPRQFSPWAPPAVLAARAARQRRQQLFRAATIAAAVLVFVAAFLAVYLISLRWQLQGLRAEVDAAAALAAPSIRTAGQWEAVVSSIDPRQFALEKLLLAVDSMPPDGIRLSVFESTPTGIRIEGDARNVGLATLYFNTLQTQPDAQDYTWEMGSPALQPDNSARFAIDGTRQP